MDPFTIASGLASFVGGVKHNAIPSKAVAVLSVRSEDVAAIKTLLAYQEKQYQHEYSVQDPGLTFVVEYHRVHGLVLGLH